VVAGDQIPPAVPRLLPDAGGGGSPGRYFWEGVCRGRHDYLLAVPVVGVVCNREGTLRSLLGFLLCTQAEIHVRVTQSPRHFATLCYGNHRYTKIQSTLKSIVRALLLFAGSAARSGCIDPYGSAPTSFPASSSTTHQDELSKLRCSRRPQPKRHYLHRNHYRVKHRRNRTRTVLRQQMSSDRQLPMFGGQRICV